MAEHYSKKALEHLQASGAACISLLRDGTIETDDRPHRDSAAAYWLPRSHVERVAEVARSMIAGGDRSRAISRASMQCGVMATRHDRAIALAKLANEQIADTVEVLRQSGQLQSLMERHRNLRAVEVELRAALRRGTAGQMLAQTIGA